MAQKDAPQTPGRPQTASSARPAKSLKRPHTAHSTPAAGSRARLHVLSSVKKAPAYSMPSRPQFKPLNGDGPGPGAYSPYTAGANKPPAFSMLARREDPGLGGNTASPGPGAYSPDGKLRKQIPTSLWVRFAPPSPFP